MLSREAYSLVMEGSLINSNTIHGAVIIIDDKLWIDPHYNRFLFKDIRTANRVFYDCMKWRVPHTAWRHSSENTNRYNLAYRWSYTSSSYTFTPEELSLCNNWRAFKRYMTENHGFKIVTI